MSKFTEPLVLEMLPNEMFRVYKDFEFWTDNPCPNNCNDLRYAEEKEHENANHDRYYITVNKGFETDLTSTPKWIWWLLPPHGEYGKAAVIHDYCYVNAIGTKEWADLIFLEGMEVLNVPKWKRIVMYQFVKIFGKGNY